MPTLVTGKQERFNPALWRMHLHILHEGCEKSEDDVEHLLVMPLVVRYIAIRHRTEVVLHTTFI